jgi:hypothetical protein
MKCPNCQAEIKQTELVGRSTNPGASWYELTGTELHCPECDAKLTFTRLPQIVGGIGGIFYIFVLLSNLVIPENPYKFQTNILGLFIFIICITYWHRKKELRIVK